MARRALISVALAAAISACSEPVDPAQHWDHEPPATPARITDSPVNVVKLSHRTNAKNPSEESVAPIRRIRSRRGIPELEGTTWAVGGLIIAFQEGGHILATGPSVSEYAPGGAPGRCAIRDGIVELEILGRIYTGSWDGDALIVEGKKSLSVPIRKGWKRGASDVRRP